MAILCILPALWNNLRAQDINSRHDKDSYSPWRPVGNITGTLAFVEEAIHAGAGVSLREVNQFGIGGGLESSIRIELLSAYTWYRRDHFFGKGGTSLYGEIWTGVKFVRKSWPAPGEDEPDEKKGDMRPYLRLAPGFSVRIWRSVRFNIGPMLKITLDDCFLDSFGLSAGISF